MADKNLNINIIAKDKSRQALSKVQGRLNSVKNSVFSLKGALIGIGAGAVIKSFVDVGREIESLGVRFKFLFGSAEEGAKAFDNLSKFAGRVPFSLEAISRASGNLAVVAKDADDLNRILEITGNVASVTGLDFETTASQIQRAFAGGIASADIFREKGVRSLLGFKEGAKVSVDETVEAFEKAFSGKGRFANATKDLAKTLDGTLSMIGDKYFNFQKDVAEGFFDQLKSEFGDLNTFLEDNEKQIEDIATAIGKNFATAITKTSQALKDIAPAFKTVADTSGKLIDGFNSLPSEVKTAGILGVLLFGKKGLAVAGVLALVVDKVTDIAKITEDLSIVDPNDLTNVKAIEDRLKLLNEEIEKTQQLTDNPLTLDLPKGIQLDASDVFPDLNSEGTLNSLIHDRNSLLRILNNLNFEQSEAYTNLNAVIIEQSNKQKELNKEQKKSAEQIIVFKDAVGLLDNDFNNLFNTLGEKNNFNQIMEDAKNLGEELGFLQQSSNDFKEGFKEAMDKNIFEGFKSAGETAFKSLKSTLTDFVMTGKLDMKSFGDAIKRALVEALIGQAVQMALDKSLELFKMRSIKSALISVYEGALKVFASIPFPFNILAVGGAISFGMGLVNKIRGFADGGRPPVGRPSLVGERGAELFVPDSAGTIVPNDQLGGGSTTVNFNITTVDAKGFNELLVNSRGMIVNLINTAVNEKGKPALI